MWPGCRHEPLADAEVGDAGPVSPPRWPSCDHRPAEPPQQPTRQGLFLLPRLRLPRRARRPAPTPIGLVEHLGYAERHWFQEVLLGDTTALPWPPDDPDSGPLETDHPTPEVFAFYRDQCRRSREILSTTALSTAAVATHRYDPVLAAQTTDLRRIVLHMIEETARHAGHLDVVRELLDGRTGLGPR
ncbi:MAG: DUF664 domain-containing protein [Angustibacter sp.]